MWRKERRLEWDSKDNHLQGAVGTESWGGVNVEEGQAGEGSLLGHGKGHLGRGWWPWREWR